MPQSLARIVVHLVFSTKNRRPLLAQPALRRELEAYLATVLRGCDSPAILVGAVSDHVHLLHQLSKNHPASKIVEEVKKNSSKWLKTKGPSLEMFQWQAGYGMFSVSDSHVREVTRYIAGQEEHHQRENFQDEFRRLLEAHHVPYDERYLWD